MASLSDSTASFLLRLQKSTSEFQVISDKLEQEFSDRYPDGNPFYILSRIRRLKQELPLLVKETQEVLSDKSAALSDLTTGLAQSLAALERLEGRAGLESDPRRREHLKSLEGSLGGLDRRRQQLAESLAAQEAQGKQSS